MEEVSNYFDAYGYDLDDDGPDQKLEYLRFIRDVVFGSRSHLKQVTAYRFPEFGTIRRSEINELIKLYEEEVKLAKGVELNLMDPEQLKVKFRVQDGYVLEVKEDNMGTMDPEFYERQAAAMLARAETLRGVPQTDVFDEGTVLTWGKLRDNMVAYQYAAIKADGTWYVTGGRSPQTLFWPQLVEFIGVSGLPSVRVVTQKVGLKEWAANVQKVLEDKATPE
jgi:hypothetical protein